MAFLEARPLDCAKMGAVGGPQFSTSIVSVRSGAESRNRNWTEVRHRYEIGQVARPLSEFTAIRDAFMIVGGKADGFRFKDWTDYTVTGSLWGPAAPSRDYASRNRGAGLWRPLVSVAQAVRLRVRNLPAQHPQAGCRVPRRPPCDRCRHGRRCPG